MKEDIKQDKFIAKFLERLPAAIFISLFIVISTLFGLLVFYLIKSKSAAGIDLFPGFSLGIWGWFKGLF